MLGDVQLIEERGALYAECDNAAVTLPRFHVQQVMPL